MVTKVLSTAVREFFFEDGLVVGYSVTFRTSYFTESLTQTHVLVHRPHSR